MFVEENGKIKVLNPESYWISIQATKLRNKLQKKEYRDSITRYRRIDPKAPIVEQDLDDIINWYNSVRYGLIEISIDR